MDNTAALEFHPGCDGARLAVHRLGAGRPVLLLHGLFSSAEVNWIKYGTAAQLAAAGFEAIMPDLRGLGHSAAPHDAEAYPDDVLARDLAAMVASLRVTDYDLGGFSLGARTALRGVLTGLDPRRLVLGGMGLEGLIDFDRRAAHFVDILDRYGTIGRGEPGWAAQAFIKTTGIDRQAVRLLLHAGMETRAAQLAVVTMPVLVVCGAEDSDNGSAAALTAALPNARHVAVPGTHMSSVTHRELGAAIVGFLSG